MRPVHVCDGDPILLDLSNPCAQVLFPSGHYTYAFGNTPAVELTEHFGTSRYDDTLNILLLGTGDIRNLLRTVSELSQRFDDAKPESLCFHLNDYDTSVLARDVIILETASSIDPDCDQDVDFLWNLWYNLALSKQDSQRLQTIIQSLVSQEHVQSHSQFGSKAVFTECKEIWKDWLHLDMNIDDVTRQRQKLMLYGLNLADDNNFDVCENQVNFVFAVSSLTETTIKQLLTPTDEKKLDHECLQKPGLLYQEIYSYFLRGCTSPVDTADSKVNPTLVRPFEHKWKVHYGSCPFAGYIPINRKLLETYKSIGKSCKEQLKTWVKHFQRYSRFKSETPRIKVIVWSGDALELCRYALPKDALFDVIDTSNLSDHVGLLNILLCCVRRLKEPGQSQLITSTMLWRASGLSSLPEYLECSLGIRQSLYPTVFGLKLAEDLNLGRSDILTVKRSRRIEDRLIWVKTEKERSPIILARSPDILDALKSIASRCFRLPSAEKRSLQLCGVTLSSPVTFFLTVLQMVETFHESAEHVLSYVEESLPTVRLFQKRACAKICALSWNVLKCLSGLSQGVILKVQVQVAFPNFSRNTPVMQAVLFEDPTDGRFLKAWPVFQLEQRTFHKPVHLLYNNVRYDLDKDTASFLMLESDWESLHVDTVLVLISSSVSFTSQPVELKSSHKTTTKNAYCLMNEDNDTKDRNTLAEDNNLRSKRMKSHLARNLSCISVSCVSDVKHKGLQKYDSCYKLEILGSQQDLVMHDSGHIHSSTDCLFATEKNTDCFFQKGIVSPCFQLNDDTTLGRKVAGDVIDPNGGHTVNHAGGNTTVATEQVDGVTESFGLLNATWVMLESPNSDHLELLALEEHSLCYNADIRILKTCPIVSPTLSPTVKYYPKDMPSKVEISFDNERLPLKLYFSSPVDQKFSKVQMLSHKQRLRCHFPKSELGICGRTCIKRPPLVDFSSLPKWTGMEDLNKEVSLGGESFVELQNALLCIIASFVEYPQTNNCFSLHESLGRKAVTPSLTLVIHEVYSHKQAPLAKVLFCDHSVTAFPSPDARNSTTATKYREILIEVMANKQESPMLHLTKQGQVLLKRLLYSNAKQVMQTERLKPVWIDSFLQLIF